MEEANAGNRHRAPHVGSESCSRRESEARMSMAQIGQASGGGPTGTGAVGGGGVGGGAGGGALLCLSEVWWKNVDAGR